MILDTVSASDALAIALRHHQQGHLYEAGAIYFEILREDPDNADALHLVGLLAHQNGNHAEAIDYIERAIAARDDVAIFHNNLATACLADRRFDQAVSSCRRCLQLQPHFPEASNNLANALLAQGNPGEAIRWYERALELNPAYAEAQYNLANVYQDQHRYDDAIRLYQQVLEDAPDFLEAWANLGKTWQFAGQLNHAEDCFERVLAKMPDNMEVHYRLANLCRTQQRYSEAVPHYQRVLDQFPDQVEVIGHLGNTLKAMGRHDEAIQQFQAALLYDPKSAEVHNNLGNVFTATGRSAEAANSYERAIALRPNYADAHSNLGAVQATLGQLDEAIHSCRRALAIDPDFAEAHNNLGNALKYKGEVADAVLAYERAVALKPDFYEACTNLGLVLGDQGKHDQARGWFEQAIRLDAGHPDAHNHLGNALADVGRLTEALPCYEQALRCDPRNIDACNNLGNALAELRRLDESAWWYDRALQIDPQSAQIEANLAGVLREQCKLAEAAEHCQRALELEPENAAAWNNLAAIYKSQGQPEKAVECYERLLAAAPGEVEAHSNALSCRHYLTGITLAELAELHAQWDRQHAVALQATWESHDNDRSPDRPLRLGFVSGDFGRHAVGYFLQGVLEQIDRTQFEVCCYNQRAVADDLTSILKSTAYSWQDVRGLSHAELADRIRRDRVDLLFDLGGHFADNRLLTFARKPAPLQASWMGYVGTTGLSAMDFVVADGYHVPAEFAPHYREAIMRMPHGYVCYSPPPYAPDVVAPPALSGPLTFGCFNNPAKIGNGVLSVWAEIMRCLPESRLLLKYGGFDDVGIQSRFIRQFDKLGIARDRLCFEGKSKHAELLSSYNRVDIGLDSFPYSGGLTTCEALWMGVPVITCPHETFASRHSFSHLTNAGFPQLVAGSLDEYVGKAIELAADREAMIDLRRSMRSRVQSSPLCDTARFARDFEHACRLAWHQYCIDARPA